MDSSRELFLEMVNNGGHACREGIFLKAMSAKDCFKERLRPNFTIDEHTCKHSDELNEHLKSILEGFRTHYRSSCLAHVDIYLGVIKEPSPQAGCYCNPKSNQAVLIWNSGLSDIAFFLAQFLTNIGKNYREATVRDFIESWEDLIKLGVGVGSKLRHTYIFSSDDDDDYRKFGTYMSASPVVFFSGVQDFVLGHECGHILLSTEVGQKRLKEVSALIQGKEEHLIEMFCDIIGLYICVARCLTVWGGTIDGSTFAFPQRGFAHEKVARRNISYFESFLCDYVIAISSLFAYHEALERNGNSKDSISHPRADVRMVALLSSSAGSLLGPEFSPWAQTVARRLSMFNEQCFGTRQPDKESQQLLSAVRVLETAFRQELPQLSYKHWGTQMATATTKGGKRVHWFPRAPGGSDVREESIVGVAKFDGKGGMEFSTSWEKTEMKSILKLMRNPPKQNSSRSIIGILKNSFCFMKARYHYNKGVKLAMFGENAAAVLSYTEAIEWLPTLASAFYNRGNALTKCNEIKRAEMDFRQAVSLDPNHVRALCNCGIAAAKLGNDAEALRCLDQAAAKGDEKACKMAEAIRSGKPLVFI